MAEPLSEDLPCHSPPPQDQDDVAYVEGHCSHFVKILFQRITKPSSSHIVTGQNLCTLYNAKTSGDQGVEI